MRLDEVYRKLAEVYDPELDQPLTDLGFIGGVEVADGDVTVYMRLPTFWCAANFAYMMAADIRARVSELPWVRQVEVRLVDHFCDGEINAGVNAGKSFREAFPDLATDDLDEVREAFRVKAFLARQERAVRWLLDHGWPEQAVLGLRVRDLADLAARYGEEAGLLHRYLQTLDERGLARDPAAPALVHPDGRPVRPDEFRAHLEHARRTRLTMEFNSAFCRGLLHTRYGAGQLIREEDIIHEGSPPGGL